jgi:hypothetical protein
MPTSTAPNMHKPQMRSAAAQLAAELQAGQVYRREDLSHLSNAVDRHLRELVDMGKLHKLAPGLYHAPQHSSYGPLPPSDEQLVQGFLRDKEFLVFSPSAYNTAGLGTTQLYNRTWVYNHKRHGVFRLGQRLFDFRVKPRFPKQLDPEFLFVDLINNLEELAEDRDAVLSQAHDKIPFFDATTLQEAVHLYGNMATRKRFRKWALQ